MRPKCASYKIGSRPRRSSDDRYGKSPPPTKNDVILWRADWGTSYFLARGPVVDEAARARSRRRWLENAATEEATLGGVLLDLAERRRPVIVRTLAGHRVAGPIIAVGADFVGVADSRLGDTLMPTTRSWSRRENLV